MNQNKAFDREDAKSAKKIQCFIFIINNDFFNLRFLRGLRAFAVKWFFFLLFCCPFIQGCSLLFVVQGGTHYLKAGTGKKNEAPSLERELDRRVVLEYKTREGDTLAAVARAYYGRASKARKIASFNRLNFKRPLRKGTRLRIPDPLLYPNPKTVEAEIGNLSKKEQAKIRRAGIPIPTPTPFLLAPKIDKVARPQGNKSFSPGEKLRFEIRALGILGGYATLEVGKAVTVAGRPCLPLTARANSVFPLTGLFPVNDVQTSYFDAVDFLPWKFENNVHEGGYKARNLEVYDQKRHKVVRTHNAESPEDLDIAPFSQDIISCFYYFRLLPFEEGKTYDIPTQSGGKNYHLIVTVEKKERITVPAGTFNCLKVKPLIQQGTVFRNNEDIDLWVTDDARHLPVKIQSGIVIGSIDVNLLDATLPKLVLRQN